MGKPGNLDLDFIRRTLAEEWESLRGVSDAASDERRPVELDQQMVGRLSRMDAMQVQAMAQAVESRRQGRLRRIEAALRRLDEGEFGYCLECGYEIPARRLAIDSTFSHCADCAG